MIRITRHWWRHIFFWWFQSSVYRPTRPIEEIQKVKNENFWQKVQVMTSSNYLLHVFCYHNNKFTWLLGDDVTCLLSWQCMTGWWCHVTSRDYSCDLGRRRSAKTRWSATSCREGTCWATENERRAAKVSYDVIDLWHHPMTSSDQKLDEKRKKKNARRWFVKNFARSVSLILMITVCKRSVTPGWVTSSVKRRDDDVINIQQQQLKEQQSEMENQRRSRRSSSIEHARVWHHHMTSSLLILVIFRKQLS